MWAAPVEDAHSASELALAAIVDLYGVPLNAGIFITDYPNTDDWPDPLPCPGVWPPL